MKKSFVRVKVWIATPIIILGFLYFFYSYIAANYDVINMTPVQIAVFSLALAMSFYRNHVKCERCKTRWYDTGKETYREATSMLDFTRKFLTQRNYNLEKKCRVCGLERY